MTSDGRVPKLIERFPGLAGSTPFCNLGVRPSPVQRLEVLEQRTGASSIWYKPDAMCGRPVGGGELRKLEWVLAQAAKSKATGLLTTGPRGCEFILAAAVYCHQQGLSLEALTYPAHDNPRAQKIMRTIDAYGARIWETSSRFAAQCLVHWHHAQGVSDEKMRSRKRIAQGGANTIGALGFVEAGLELAEQIQTGKLPQPKAIFIPAVTGTSAVGLQIGCRLAGLESQVVAVGVTKTCTERHLKKLCKATVVHLDRAAPKESLTDMQDATPSLLREFIGDGFGHTTEQGQQARTLASDIEGIKITAASSSKTFSAMLRQIIDWTYFRQKTVLFWNTSAEWTVSSSPNLR